MRFNDISVISNRRHISLLTEDILYIQLSGRQSIIHFSDGRTYETYATIHELKSMLGSGFIRADRATLVSIKGIHDIGKEIELVNGETLYYSCRKKRELKEQLRAGRRLRGLERGLAEQRAKPSAEPAVCVCHENSPF